MTFEHARSVADAVLFEGYLLYPYRASALKNHMRWQFGVLAPRSDETEPCFARTECLVEPESVTSLDIQLRFLHLHTRWTDPPWDEGVVREVEASVTLDRPTSERVIPFDIPGSERVAEVRSTSISLSGFVTVRTRTLDSGLLRVRVCVENNTPWIPLPTACRDAMLRRSLVSTHTLLGVRGGRFVSLLDPPEWARPDVDGCANAHTWPVLVGNPERRDFMLSAPIILYDFPAVAEQSAGDLFDATEIDEILTLRTMTLTDAEKQEARATDPRAAAIIDRVETMSPEVIGRMHGTARRPNGGNP